jgi:hypothetical protein
MMWKKKPQVQVVVAAVLEPVAEEASPALSGSELAEYTRLCESIGWSPAALTEQRLRSFLDENGLCVYPYERVRAYLDNKFGPLKGNVSEGVNTAYWTRVYTTWCWRPLRAEDVNAHRFNMALRGQNGSVINDGGFYHGRIPLEVLMTVENVKEHFPEVRFFVSDVIRPEERVGDPFLGISFPGLETTDAPMLVVERWNEPAFRM